MQTIIKLNEDDMINIIANHYQVDKSNVKIRVEQECVGYGIGEHMEPFVFATVIK